MLTEAREERPWHRQSWPWPAMTLGVIALAAAAVRVAAIAVDGAGAWREPRESLSVIFFHLVAEFLMATLPAVGAIAWWRGRRSGPELMVLGLGASIYASLNAIGWALVNEVALLVPMTLGLPMRLCPVVKFTAAGLLIAGTWG